MDKPTVIYDSTFTLVVAILPGTVVAGLLIMMEPGIWHIALSLALGIPALMLLPRYKTLGKRIVVESNHLLVTRWGNEQERIAFRDIDAFTELVGAQLGFEISLQDGRTRRVATLSPSTHKKLEEYLASRCHD